MNKDIASNNETNTENKTSAYIVETIVLIFFISLLAGPLSGFILSTASFFAKISNQLVVQYQSTKQLANELIESSTKIKNLEREIADSKVEIIDLKEKARETDSLRSLLQLKRNLTNHTKACDVIAHTPSNWFSQIIVDKGLNDKVQPGFAVMCSNAVIGQVIECSNESSIVRLISDPQQKVGVVIPKANITGILAGAYDKPPTINFVPLSQNVEPGQEVLTLGKGGSFPPNQLIGTVSKVSHENNGASLLIEVKLTANLENLSSVLIVGKSESP